MKVLMVEPGPAFSVADVHAGWRKALKAAGVEVLDAGLHERIIYYTEADKALNSGNTSPQDIARVANECLLSKSYLHVPDVVLITSAFFVAPELYPVIRARGQRIVVLLTEEPYEHPSQLDIAARADVAIVNDPINLDAFREVNPHTYYIPHAYDPDIHHPRQPQPELVSDFAWVGTAYPSRIKFFEQVDWSSLDVKLAGNWQNLPDGSPLHKYLIGEKEECLDNVDAVDLYAATGASANLYRQEAAGADHVHGWAMSPREVELAACGTFWMAEPRGENRAVLPMVPTFTDPDDFSRKLRWWLAHPDERLDVAEAARQAVADRTFDHSVAFLLDALDNLSR